MFPLHMHMIIIQFDNLIGLNLCTMPLKADGSNTAQ